MKRQVHASVQLEKHIQVIMSLASSNYSIKNPTVMKSDRTFLASAFELSFAVALIA